MALTPGTRFGAFEVTAQLGVGGMGEVYRATDTNLKRQVAIKVLPASVAGDAERLARFQREAEVLAALNHPNIAAIYGLEKTPEFTALVMELVEGDDLSQRIARGAIPADEALPIAKQIAEALEAAHEQGIIHRDLKPANIKVRADGTVKVLDFGLAKAMEPAGASGAAMSASMLPTITTPAMTQAGMILGTAAYMSPEQARGKAVDKRADIWAFGAVLYEMLTGTRAFAGDDVSITMASVLMKEPEWAALPAGLSPALGTYLRRCLQKDPRQRVQAIGDVRLALEGAFDTSVPEAFASVLVPQSRPRWRRAVPVVAAAVVAGAMVGAVAWTLRPRAPASPVTRFAFTLGEGQIFGTGGAEALAMSPDGTSIVYVANRRLYLRRMNEPEAKAIPGSENPLRLTHPVFSPDGSAIAFYAVDDGTIRRIAVTGGAAISLCAAGGLSGVSWSEDGILFGQPTGIFRVSANGGKPEALVTLADDEVATAPQMLPGGKAVLFSLATGTGRDRWNKATIVVQTIGSADRKMLIDDGNNGRYLPTGHIVYAYSGTLRAVPFDLQRLEVTGGPVPVIEGVARSLGRGVAHFSVSGNGSLAYIPGPVAASESAELTRIDREGRFEPLKLQPGAYDDPRVSPDGTQVAFQTDDGRESIVWIYDLSEATAVRRLTFGGNNRFPIWSPDSRHVAFQSDREGDLAMFRQPADGSGGAERLTTPDAGTSHHPDSWSSNGNTLLFEVRKESSGALWALSMRDKKAAPFGNIQNSNPIDAVFSPDGRWVAYTSRETGKNEVFMQPFPATGAKYQISKGADNHHPVWSPDGKELFYVPGPSLAAGVSVTVQPGFALGNPVDVFRGLPADAPSGRRNFDIMPDGKHLLMFVNRGGGSGLTVPQVHVVLNWFEELKRLVPTN